MSIQGIQLIQAMNQYAPPSLAMDKDRIGLQIGSATAEVQGVLVALDVTDSVVEEAVQQGANWIIAHHAILFRPLSEIRTDQPEGKLIARLIKEDIQVFVAHTNLDIAEQGVNDRLADLIGLGQTEVLLPQQKEKLLKLVVFVPMDHHIALRDALGKAGAGWIGNYSHCTFNMEGIGTFLPREGTNPYIGQQGGLEQVQEIRLETIVTQNQLQSVLQAMYQAHPYEEVAYDLYPVQQEGPAKGLGRIGRLPQPVTLQQLAEQMKSSFQVPALRYVGGAQQIVEKVAIIGGSGGRFWREVMNCGADVLITGDVDYHTALDAEQNGFALIDPGHHVEHLVTEQVVQVLKSKFHDAIEIHSSCVEQDPFQFI